MLLRVVCVLPVCLFVLTKMISGPACAAETGRTVTGPLAEYVKKEDASYGWIKKQEGKLGTGTFSELILTSQTWRDIQWKHQLFVFKPSTLKDASQAILLIDGGQWKDELETGANSKPPESARLLTSIAEQLGAPVAVLRQVPQQPMFGGMHEDQIISFTFAKYLETRDPEWPLLLPMVKSAVRGMDAVQEFAKQEWKADIQSFTVTGASKRGWTTWLTAAVDPRVNSLAPMVIDMLNMGPQMLHQVASFGKFSEQLKDYTSKGLPKFLSSAAGIELAAMVDPYSYRSTITQPKLIMLGTNDRYWPLDALNLYWNGLVGEKYILYLPNNGHGLKDYPRILGSLSALHQRAAKGTAMPELKWDYAQADNKVTLQISSSEKPQHVHVWVATSASKDFRDSKWTRQPVVSENGAFTYVLNVPKAGFSAVFGEAIYARETMPLYLATTIKIAGAKKTAKTTASE